MLIREVAQAEGKDGDVTVAIIKQELEASEEDSETALTSQSRPRKRMDSNFF